MTVRIMVVDPDHLNIEKLIRLFNGAGYACVGCPTASECLSRLQNTPCDLIITELELTDMSGTELCRLLTYNQDTAHIPVVFLSAMNAEIDKVVALSLGATDYVNKPFSSRELILRVKAILRRTVRSRPQSFVSNGVICLDSRSHRAWANGNLLQLTKLEFKMLTALVGAGGHVLKRDDIINAVWGASAHVLDRTVDAHIRTLRKKLGAAKSELETVQGVGYRIRQHSDGTDSHLESSPSASGYTDVNNLF
ncbi:MAG: response regulator transcription factor [Deltaproteobacteria bacterium]|nr:response regulator transcription factor [Deltaproteobacteria bacterium]